MLTDAAIKKLKAPPTGQSDVTDGADVKGLVVRVSSKARVFYLAYRTPDGGKQARIRIGEWPAVTLSEAREKGRAYRRLLEQGLDPREHERQETERKSREAQEARQEASKRAQNTFAKATEDFIAHCQKANLRRWQERKRHFDVYVPADWRDRQVDTITRDDLEELLQTIEAERGPVMANRVIQTLRAMFNWLAAKKRATDNPAAKLRCDVPETERDRVLSDGELAAVWRASEKLGQPWQAFVRILILTGQRRQEVASMRWRDIDLEAGIWEMPREASKMNRAHSVPLSPLAVDVLNSLPRFAGSGNDAFIFTTTAGSTHVSAYSKLKGWLDGHVEEIANEGTGPSVAPWRIHDLRRTSASGMARLGVALHVIEKVLNHSSGAISGIAAIYNRHGYDDEKRKALEAWANQIAVVADTSGKLLRLANRA